MKKIITLIVNIALFAVSLLWAGDVLAKVYIDISSPALRQFPMAVYDFSDDETGKELTAIIKNDLEFTGFFYFVDKEAFIEDKADDFDAQNWSPIGVEAVLKGNVSITDKIQVVIRLYDVVESKVIIFKQYTSDKGQVRPLAHMISDDIYYALTEQRSVFRTKIAFVADKGKQKELMIMDYDGERIKGTGFQKSMMLSPHWFRDGSKIVISASDGGQWSIYLVDFKSMKSRKMISSGGVNIAGNFSPDGDSFVFSSSRSGAINLYRYDLSRNKIKKVTSSWWIDISPSLSPDGDQIVFVSDKVGNPHVYIMDLKSYNISRVTFEGVYNTSPSWSPRGDMIVFSGMVEGKNQIFTVRNDGTDLRQLTSSGNNEEPVFSPDSRHIVFTSDRDGHKAIYTMRTGGENQKRVSTRGYRAFGPEWGFHH